MNHRDDDYGLHHGQLPHENGADDVNEGVTDAKAIGQRCLKRKVPLFVYIFA